MTISVRFGFDDGSGWFGLTEERYVCAKMSVRTGQGESRSGQRKAKNCKERRVTSASRAEESDDDGRVGVETAKQAENVQVQTTTH